MKDLREDKKLDLNGSESIKATNAEPFHSLSLTIAWVIPRTQPGSLTSFTSASSVPANFIRFCHVIHWRPATITCLAEQGTTEQSSCVLAQMHPNQPNLFTFGASTEA